MNFAKLTIAGAMALSLAACHTPEHRFCDDDNRTVCLLLLGGAVKAVALIALSNSDDARPI